MKRQEKGSCEGSDFDGGRNVLLGSRCTDTARVEASGEKCAANAGHRGPTAGAV